MLNAEQIVHVVHAFFPDEDFDSFRAATENGVCNGFTSMWLQAIVQGKKSEAEFTRRLRYIADHYLQEGLLDKQALREDVQDTLSDLAQSKQPATAEQQMLVDIRAFVEGLSLQQSPDDFLDIFDNAQVTQRHKEKLFKLTESIQQQNSGDEVAVQYLGQSILDNKGLGDYLFNLETTIIMQYLQAVEQQLLQDKSLAQNQNKQQKIQDLIDRAKVQMTLNQRESAKIILDELDEIYPMHYPVGLLMSSEEHTIGFEYNLAGGQWRLMDINKVGLQGVFAKSLSTDTPEKSAAEVMDSLDDMDLSCFSSMVVTSRKQLTLIDELKQAHDQTIQHYQALQSLTNDRGTTSFMLACLENDIELINTMINSHDEAYLNAQNNIGYTALHFACDQGNLAVVEALMQQSHKFNLNATNRHNQTPLMIACREGHMGIVQAFMQNNDLELEDAFYMALNTGHTDIAKFIIDSGQLSLNPTDDAPTSLLFDCLLEGATSLAQAVLQSDEYDSNRFSSEYQQFLESYHARDHKVRNKITENLMTMFMQACRHGDHTILSTLLQEPSLVKKLHQVKYEPIKEPMVWDHPDILLQLIEANFIELNPSDGTLSPLWYACQQGDYKLAEKLIEMGANPNFQDKNGKTPLHIACKKGFPKTVTKLVEGGADVNRLDNTGQSPIEVSFHARCLNGYKALLASDNIDVSPMQPHLKERFKPGVADFQRALNLARPEHKFTQAVKQDNKPIKPGRG